MKFTPVFPLTGLFLILFSCNSEPQIDAKLIPLNSESYVKLEKGSATQYVQFELKDVTMVEIDRILDKNEFVQIDFCNSYNLREQQTWVFEYNQRYCLITARLNSPLYIALR